MDPKQEARARGLIELTRDLERGVDMPALLQSRGYIPDLAGGQTVWSKGNDELVVAKEPSGWQFRDSNGTAGGVAALLRRMGIEEKRVVETLLALSSPASRDPEALAYHEARAERAPAAVPPARNVTAPAAAAWEMEPGEAAKRRLEALGIRPETLDPRFASLPAQTLLKEAAEKLWWSKPRPGDRTLVLVERPLDAAAHAALTKETGAVYMAIGGSFQEGAPGKDARERELRHVLASARGLTVVVAVGTGPRGAALSQRVRELAPSGTTMVRHAPQFGASWGDQLVMQRKHEQSVQALKERTVAAPGLARGM